MIRRFAGFFLVSATLVATVDVAWSQPAPPRITRGNDLSTMAREPFQIFDNLYFVGIGEVGSYVIETSDGLILIDTLWDLPGYTDYLLLNVWVGISLVSLLSTLRIENASNCISQSLNSLAPVIG